MGGFRRQGGLEGWTRRRALRTFSAQLYRTRITPIGTNFQRNQWVISRLWPAFTGPPLPDCPRVCLDDPTCRGNARADRGEAGRTARRDHEYERQSLLD